jgi:uncharacterized protein YraI
MRRLIGLFGLIGMVFGFGIMPAVAQTPEWEAWMYNSDNGRMVLVGSDNVIYDDFMLPGLQGNNYSWRVMVSPDGNTILYSLSNTFNASHTIYAYSTLTDSIIMSYLIPAQQGQFVYDSIELNPTTQAFSPDGRSVAIGYMVESRWSLIVIDLFNQPGTVLLQVNSTDPNMRSIQPIALDVPTVIRYDGTNIDFVVIQAAADGAPSYPHYTYNRSTNTVAQNYYFTVPGGDFNARDGRYVFSIEDYRLTNSNHTYQGYGQQINALHMWLPNKTETYPVFNAPNHSIARPTFIQNGEKILVLAYDWVRSVSDWWSIDQSTPTPTILTSLQDVHPLGLEGVGNGFVISVTTNEVVNIFPQFQNLPNQSVLLYFDTRASANGAAVNQMWLGGENQQFKLVWARDNQLGNRPIVGQWAAVGNSANASNYDTLSQSAQRTTPNTLQIGGQARVFTTDGDRANMRSGAGTNFSVVEQVANDTVVTILGGPQGSDRFIWWRVQTATSSGWIVESADGLRVLQPFGAVVIPTVAPPVVSPSSNLFVGGSARVTSDGNNLNARKQPSTNAPVVTILQAGQTYSILSGPMTVDGFTWWQIDTPQGRAWVAEGTLSEKWIVPSQ